MPSISDTRPASLRGMLSEAVSKRKPYSGSSHAAFAEKGIPWGVPYEGEGAEPVRRDAPDIFKGFFTEADMTRMLDADMTRRRKQWDNLRKVLGK